MSDKSNKLADAFMQLNFALTKFGVSLDDCSLVLKDLDYIKLRNLIEQDVGKLSKHHIPVNESEFRICNVKIKRDVEET